MNNKKVLTEIPDLGDISKFADDLVFDDAFWDNVVESIRKENKMFKEQEARMKPTREDMLKEFNL